MPLPSNERVGTLTAASTAYRLNLAADRPSPYRPGYRLVWPEYQDVPGAEGKVAGDPSVRVWHVDSWLQGEGEDLWRRGFYNESQNVRPAPVGDTLVLGAFRELTVDDAGTPATFVEGKRFGLGLGKLWACADSTVHAWQPATGNWGATGTATGSATAATSIVDAEDGTNLLIGKTGGVIRKVAPGGANSELTAAFTYAPVLRSFGSVIYALDGDDLYRVDTSTGARTLVSDLGGQSGDYLGTVPAAYGRLTVSDKGPLWLQRLDSGQTYIWEYNEANDTTKRVGRLPVDFAYPYSVFWTLGWLFVGFRTAGTHASTGEAYVYYQRGQQSGVAGPTRGAGGTSASEPVLLAGTTGDDLIFYYDKAVWAYNLSDGGISMLALSETTSTTAVQDAITFGKDVFISGVDNADRVERFDTSLYSIDSANARLDSGRFDFGYMGVDKVLLDVKVVTDPLPAGASVLLRYSVEGGAFTAVSGTHNTTGATAYTWTVSSSAASVVGSDFELRLVLGNGGTGAATATTSPSIRSVTARAIAAEKQRSWVLELDAGSFVSGRGGYADRSADALASFRAWAEAQGVVKFSNPWDGEEWDSSTDYEVVVEQALLVPADPEGEPFLQVQLREAAYV